MHIYAHTHTLLSVEECTYLLYQDRVFRLNFMKWALSCCVCVCVVKVPLTTKPFLPFKYSSFVLVATVEYSTKNVSCSSFVYVINKEELIRTTFQSDT